MITDQIDLDFDGTNAELQSRMRWVENAARERAFWTPERCCLAWMQNTTPDDSDMAWWNAQPIYKRQNWLDLHQREKRRMARTGEWRRPFEVASAELDQIITEGIAQDEARISRYMDILREDFLNGRPCSLYFECDRDGFSRAHSEYLLGQALKRLAVPNECVSIERRAS